TGFGPASYASPEALENMVSMLASFLQYKEPGERSEVFSAMYDALEADGPVESSLVPAVHPWDELFAVKLAYEATDSNEVADIVKQMYTISAGKDHWVSGWDIKFSKDSHFFIPQVG